MVKDRRIFIMKAVIITGLTAALVIIPRLPVYAQAAEPSGEASAAEAAADTAIAYTSENLRDPFEAYVSPESAPMSADTLAQEENFTPPPLKISGVTWGSGYAQAIINNKVVKAGDMVDDVEIVSIAKEGLVFLYKKQKFTMPAPGLAATNHPAGTSGP